MSKRVLVVDDNLETVRLIEEALIVSGFDVASASNGAECLISIAKDRPDLVILDLSMPVLNGMEALRVLRNNPDTRYLPVIILTGRSNFEDFCDGWTEGANLYLTKPTRIGAVIAAAKWLLGVNGHEGPVSKQFVYSDF